MDVGPDQSVLVLLKHCKDMKQQETCLRLITLFVVFGCTGLFIYTFADLQLTCGGGGRQATAVQQQRECPADCLGTNSQRLQINLYSALVEKKMNGQFMKWKAQTSSRNEETDAIHIPEQGFYFIYVTITLSCPQEEIPVDFRRFHVILYRWNENYKDNVKMAEALDGVRCTSPVSRSLFVGQLFQLAAGDRVKVWIADGHQLTRWASFGAFVT